MMSSIHLLVLVHGMWGSPMHLSELDRIIREVRAEPSEDGHRLHVLLPSTNSDDSTYDGIDWGGERVAQEVSDEVSRLEKGGETVTRFSITGYSLGGLISRYVVGILRQRGFFDKVTPINFTTFATPHIGLIRWPSTFSALASRLGPKLLSRTGEQFYCVDNWSTSGKPLIAVMADPTKIFYQGLAMFRHIMIHANAINDRTVPYVTAAIELEDPFVDFETSGIQIEYKEGYPHVIKSYSLPDVPPTLAPKPTPFTPQWFKDRKNKRLIPVPPFLQFPFPFNVLLYVSLPLLVPAVISLVLIRFSLASRSSRARIKLLEKDSSSNGDRLIHIIAQLEKQVEDAVAELIDSPGDETDSPTPSSSSPTLPVEATTRKGTNFIPPSSSPPLPTSPDETLTHKGTKSRKNKPSGQPILTPLQKDIVASLNRLPIQKVVAYFDASAGQFVNSHAMIVSRDPKRFAFHRKGEGIIRHWADRFEL